MKKIQLFLIVTLFFGVIGCTHQPTRYTSVDDYPLYEGTDLGITYSPTQTKFRVWSPGAEAVRLNLYEQGHGGEPIAVLGMKRSEKGTWLHTIKQDLKGQFYTFQIQKNGKWLDETPSLWCKAVGINGDRGAIIDMKETNPQGWENDKRPEMKSFTDAIIYEVHMRDFTIASNSGSRYPGKFLGLSEGGTRSPQGFKTGLDHLKELGITHVQILPSYDYASIDETQLHKNEYNWGYDPKNYNVPEGGYATDPYNPVTRIKEMKEMIQKLHTNGIRVIMDVVYNHTYVGQESHLNLMAPGYFYRFNDDGSWSNSSGCGNETASERLMTRQFIIESVKYWVKEYHIDGFRFDLMGIHDIETMNAIRQAIDEIDPTVSIHGEGWTAGGSPLPEHLRAIKQNAHQFYPTGVFSDDIRDALRGNWMDGNKGGFLVGNGYEESLKFGVVGAVSHPQVDLTNIVHSNTAYAKSPVQVINYVSCHDDPCLVDKLKATVPEASKQELIAMNKLAQTIIFTSQGVPFIYAGEEVFRDKKGVYNSYKSPDRINQIDWSNKETYYDLFTYYRDLIALRKAHPAFRMTTAEQINNHLTFRTQDTNLISYTINDNANGDSWKTILVIFNSNRHDILYTLPAGNWIAVCEHGKINQSGLGSYAQTVNVSASSATILYQ
ncbi:MAG TPA: type I pullulanase [Salinivirgaceae bacterium]|nr:type I pullulanase [Salinivirgaceae bacterium]